MKNAGIAGGLVAIGIGLTTIGLSNFNSAPQAYAVMSTAVVAAGPEEPTIVWYDSFPVGVGSDDHKHVILRAWSDGSIEARAQRMDYDSGNPSTCGISDLQYCQGWKLISSPTEGLNAAADINFDEVVDGQDLSVLLAAWGNAPRNPMPPSDCPLGLLN